MNDTPEIAAMRVEFEKWHVSAYGWSPPRGSDGLYDPLASHKMWRAWEASRAKYEKYIATLEQSRDEWREIASRTAIDAAKGSLAERALEGGQT
jgi:hypothetical protein